MCLCEQSKILIVATMCACVLFYIMTTMYVSVSDFTLILLTFLIQINVIPELQTVLSQPELMCRHKEHDGQGMMSESLKIAV